MSRKADTKMQYKIKRNLEHSGIKGQRWGVRRFQNEDGTLTEEGKKRYGTQTRKDEDGKEIKVNVNNINDFQESELKRYHSDVNEMIKNDRMLRESNSKKVDDAKDVVNLGNDAAKILDATAKALPTGNGRYEKKDYSNISDDELRRRISRLQLEESYGRLSGETKYIQSGSEKTREILQTAGAVTAIAVAVGGLATNVAKIIASSKGATTPPIPKKP